ncbi:MAG TPA: hypothetical protein VMU01_02560, partial [Rhizomicrobium sp.]|nr:hypothetical protein [Rhizomicrobium sp.]
AYFLLVGQVQVCRRPSAAYAVSGRDRWNGSILDPGMEILVAFLVLIAVIGAVIFYRRGKPRSHTRRR